MKNRLSFKSILFFSLVWIATSTLFAAERDQGTFQITGYVLDKYTCPPCPPGAHCKPCMPDYILIVDSLESIDPTSLKPIMVVTTKAKDFQKSSKYTLTVKNERDSNLSIASGVVRAVDLVSVDAGAQ